RLGAVVAGLVDERAGPADELERGGGREPIAVAVAARETGVSLERTAARRLDTETKGPPALRVRSDDREPPVGREDSKPVRGGGRELAGPDVDGPRFAEAGAVAAYDHVLVVRPDEPASARE